MNYIVLPTIREEQHEKFLKAWQPLVDKHKLGVITVFDGDVPTITDGEQTYTIEDIMGEHADVIYNRTDAVRNAGFALAYKLGAEVIFSFDDDVLPVETPSGDTIEMHLRALSMKAPISWVNTANEEYVRGFPYGIRQESEVIVSHGVWSGVPDLDGPTQLVKGIRELSFPCFVVPKGVLFPFCAMNFAFKREAMPYIYQAPMFGDVGRFADIWGGVEMKKDLDAVGKAVATGYSYIYHTRASNVFKNLQQEARGIGMNEEYGKDPYFETFFAKRARWKEWVASQPDHQKA